MNRKVILSKRTSRKLDSLLIYLKKEWSLKVRNDFLIKFEKYLSIIRKKPDSCQKSDIQKNLFRCVVTKPTSVFYKYDNDNIYIVTMFDGRQNPEKLKSEIE